MMVAGDGGAPIAASRKRRNEAGKVSGSRICWRGGTLGLNAVSW